MVDVKVGPVVVARVGGGGGGCCCHLHFPGGRIQPTRARGRAAGSHPGLTVETGGKGGQWPISLEVEAGREEERSKVKGIRKCSTAREASWRRC